MKTKLNLNTWIRKDHFNFFNQFEEPFFSVCVNVDCTIAYQKAKAQNVSLFLYYLYCSLKAANDIEAFKYRVIGNEVFVYEVVNASSTINRPNGTFGFSYIDYKDDFKDFSKFAKIEIERVQSSTGLIPSQSGDNVIHFSAIPWVNFTGLTHARCFSFKDSVPKISFGKITDVNGMKSMPVSITVHHGLMDGFHIGQYVELFQKLLDEFDIEAA